MEQVFRFTTRVSRIINWFGGGVLIFMMLLTVSDVVLRYLKRPIPGTYELVSLAGGVAIALAVPLTTWEKGHISADLLFEIYPKAKCKALNVFTRLIGVSLMSLLGRNLLEMGKSLYRTGEGTLTIQMPVYPIAFVLGVSCLLQGLVLAIDVVRTLTSDGEKHG